jgi:hypothetical protein
VSSNLTPSARTDELLGDDDIIRDGDWRQILEVVARGGNYEINQMVSGMHCHQAPAAKSSLCVREIGSFHVGSRMITLSGLKPRQRISRIVKKMKDRN